jgi:hypothetical protein
MGYATFVLYYVPSKALPTLLEFTSSVRLAFPVPKQQRDVPVGVQICIVIAVASPLTLDT